MCVPPQVFSIYTWNMVDRWIHRGRWEIFVATLLVVTALAMFTLDERTRGLAASTASLAGTAGMLALLIGAPLALVLVRTNVPGRTGMLLIMTALLLVPLYVQAAAWQAALDPQGWLTQAGATALIQGFSGAVWIHTAAGIPWVVLIVGLGVWLAEPELEEEALLDASVFAVFRRVTLRRAAASAMVAGLWLAITISGEMTVTNLMQVRTLAEEIYTQFALGDTPGDAASASAAGTLATAWLILAALIVVTRLAPRHRHTSQRAPRLFRLGPWRWPCGMLAWTGTFALAGVPVASLIATVGIVITRQGDTWTRSWSTAKCLDVIANSPSRFGREFGWSLAIGSLAACLAVMIALPLAWSARRGGWRALPAWLLVAACLAIPGPIVGIGLIWLVNQPGAPWLTNLYDNSIAAPLLAQTLRILPLPILIMWHALASVPDELPEAAATEGAGRLTRFLRIAVASRLGPVALAWLVALAMAIGELDASLLVVPPRVTLLSIEIFGLIHYGVNDYVAGICLVLVLGFFLVAASVWLVALRRMHAWHGRP